MSIVQRLADLLAPPDIDVAAYNCRDCGTVHDTDHAACPDCGGEVRRIDDDPVPMFWAQL